MPETHETAFQAMRTLWFEADGVLRRAIEQGLATEHRHGFTYEPEDGLEIRKAGDCLGMSFEQDGASDGDVTIEIEYGPDIRDFPEVHRDLWGESGRHNRKTVKRLDFPHIARQAMARLAQLEINTTAAL